MLKKEYIIHALFWLLPSIYILVLTDNFIIGVFSKREETLFIPFLYGTLFNMVLFYSNVLIISKAFQKEMSHHRWILLTLILFFSITIVESILDYAVIHKYKPNENYELVSNIFIGNLVIHTVFYGLSLAYIFTLKTIKNEQQKQKLIQEKLYSELTYLKSQINPHFLFNTLNNLFSLARKNSDFDTANGISKLSKMMRYMLYESNVDKITLRKEIEYIENYINLQKLRFHADDDITINFTFEGDVESFMISPLLLIPFVENAFKHGISIENASVIDLTIHVKDNVLKFTISNTKHISGKTYEYSGFGLQNVQNRLNMIYPGKHKLIVNETSERFEIILKLNS